MKVPQEPHHNQAWFQPKEPLWYCEFVSPLFDNLSLRWHPNSVGIMAHYWNGGYTIGMVAMLLKMWLTIGMVAILLEW